DVGIIMQLQEFQAPLAEIAKRAKEPGADYLKLEQELLGADHQILGGALLVKWNLPRLLQLVAQYHHHPLTLASEYRWLASIVYVADHMCVRQGIGYTLTCKNDVLDPEVLKDLNLPMERVEEIAKR